MFCVSFRLEIALFLKLDLRDELEYISEVIREFSKNYQVWYVIFMFIISGSLFIKRSLVIPSYISLLDEINSIFHYHKIMILYTNVRLCTIYSLQLIFVI